MSVRNADRAGDISRIVHSLKDKPGALLPVLHGIQDEMGYIPEEAVAIIAQEMNLTRADVHGVITFYHDFRTTPSGRHILRVCQAESCQAMGGSELTAHVRQHLAIDFHETTRDNAFTLEPVYCLGSCACSPTIMVDGQVYGRVTRERFDQIVQGIQEQ
jgi:formate dehydrogenase subunit gamma